MIVTIKYNQLVCTFHRFYMCICMLVVLQIMDLVKSSTKLWIFCLHAMMGYVDGTQPSCFWQYLWGFFFSLGVFLFYVASWSKIDHSLSFYSFSPFVVAWSHFFSLRRTTLNFLLMYFPLLDKKKNQVFSNEARSVDFLKTMIVHIKTLVVYFCWVVVLWS